MLKTVGRVLLWRWRRNPLKRRSDVAEAWITVAAAMLLLMAPAVGVVMAGVGERSALGQAQGLHHRSARLVEDASATPARFSGMADDHVRATVRWTMIDGSSRTGEAHVAAGGKAGSSTMVWLDDAGRLQPAPPTPGQADTQGAALGAASGAGVCVLVVGIWWAARVRLDVRRGTQWERAWAEFNANMGHRHA
ncbi:Rv1733c family protein [Streptomyces sp. SLBN-8D4]|uniref:Rv1733c family protein n=1 Tax=Streptomyces sp. SLBN-8D4 TaxID=3377728 RepID=UPI003C7A9291